MDPTEHPARRVARAPLGQDLPRRFYKVAASAPADAGYAVTLDGRTPRSPGNRPLVLPTEALARFVAAEWEAQADFIRIATMPATRLAHTALDAIPAAHAETAAEVARYAGSDVLCYRAEAPRGLVRRQIEAWTAWLDWARDTLGIDLAATAGVVHHPQAPASLEKVQSLARSEDDFALAGLAFATALYGSAVLALAVRRRAIDGITAFDLSRLDETFQEEQWGVDEEAAERTARLRSDAAMVEAWFAALSET